MARRRTPEELEYAAKRELRKADRRRRRPAETLAETAAAPSAPGDAGIVAGVTRNRCLVELQGERFSCRLAPKLLQQGEHPTVGDLVLLDEAKAQVTAILPRRSALIRLREDRQRRSHGGQEQQVIAANVDLAVVVAAKSRPPFHPRLIDRYLVMCSYGGVEPLICLNKVDLPGPLPDLAMYHRLGVPQLAVSAGSGEGIEALRAHLKGKTSVLVGHSGVGKSSLVNALLGHEGAVVGELDKHGRRGRHTTTSASLHHIGEDSRLLDTPGIRSWGLWAIDRDTLRHYFPEFDEPARACRYRDCSHVVEPECGVRAAAESGAVPPARYESYLRLYQESEV